MVAALRKRPFRRAFFKGWGTLTRGKRHLRDTRDHHDRSVTLCTLRAATVLSRDCRADFGRLLINKDSEGGVALA